MRKWKFLGTVALALAFALLMIQPADATTHHYKARVYKFSQNTMAISPGVSGTATTNNAAAMNYGVGGPVALNSGITYYVLAAGSTTAETLLAPAGTTYGSSKTNPVTSTVFGTDGGYIDFWCDPTDATYDLYVDIIVMDKNTGFSTVVKNFSPYIRSIFIDQTPGVDHQSVYWFNATNNTPTNTGIYFMPATEIRDMWVEIVATNSAKNLNVGTYNLSTGFLKNVLTTTAGFVKDTAYPINSTSILGTAYWPASMYGNLLANAVTGAATGNCGANTPNLGGFLRIPFRVGSSGGNNALQYNTQDADDSSSGFIYFVLRLLR